MYHDITVPTQCYSHMQLQADSAEIQERVYACVCALFSLLTWFEATI